MFFEFKQFYLFTRLSILTHSKKLLSFFSISLKFYAFKIGYEYINNEVFMPNLDRIYNHSVKLSINAGFSRDGELIIPSSI